MNNDAYAEVTSNDIRHFSIGKIFYEAAPIGVGSPQPYLLLQLANISVET